MRFFRIGFLVALFAAAAGTFAQTSPGDMVVDVPFAFSAAGEKLPAGYYVVAAHDDLIRIFNAHTRGVYISTHAATRPKPDGSKLVFHRYGSSYFLSSVWITGNATGKELFRSRAEREVSGQYAEMELAIVRPAQ